MWGSVTVFIGLANEIRRDITADILRNFIVMDTEYLVFSVQQILKLNVENKLSKVVVLPFGSTLH